MKTARQTALTLLAKRDYTPLQLQQKLSRKNFTTDEIQHLIATLLTEGLLNQERYVENFIDSRREKGLGPLRIQRELTERGIATSLIEEMLNITDNTWQVAAHLAWKKRFKGIRAHDTKSFAQQMRFLLYRGYTREQIQSILKHYETE